MSPERLQRFISEVFYNLDVILNQHSQTLQTLFARQRAQHPILQGVADIILESGFSRLCAAPVKIYLDNPTAVRALSDAYRPYVEHYLLAESIHRREMERNWRYQAFIEESSSDPRLRRRDLIAFLSRPVTHLTLLSRLLTHLHRLTSPAHPDVAVLSELRGTLDDLIHSTHTGIAAAESKVKIRELCENLSLVPGEFTVCIFLLTFYSCVFLISRLVRKNMNLGDDRRTLLHWGHLTRTVRCPCGFHGLSGLFVALLDNYCAFLVDWSVGIDIASIRSYRHAEFK
jgi:hypothetical protein